MLDTRPCTTGGQRKNPPSNGRGPVSPVRRQEIENFQHGPGDCPDAVTKDYGVKMAECYM